MTDPQAPAEDQSGLAILVHAAETAIADLRLRYDPSASEGMPAHVTILWPFIQPDAITDQDIAALATCFANHRRFAIELNRLAAFGKDGIYLAPQPAAPLIDLTEAVVANFPDYPPYRGAYATIIPHLTVAMTSPQNFANIHTDCIDALTANLPIHVDVDEVTLFVRRDERWRTRQTFPLSA